MRTSCARVLVLMAIVASAGTATAAIGTPDGVPAATLLIPYFQVDLDNPNGITTLVTVQNSSATAILARVTLWTDVGIPTVAFDVYLTGYDVEAMNLRDVLVGGNLPFTASDGQDPSDTISNQGPLSQDINFASCSSFLPPSNPALDAAMLAHLQAWHTGQQSPTTGLCAGVNYGETVARGYLTVDTVNQCSVALPTTPGYFGPGGTGIATNQNVLLGDWLMVDPNNNFMEAERAVAIEASWTDPAVTTPGQYTFYGRLVAGSAADNREPLPTTWGAPYMTERSYLRVWRDAGEVIQPFNCNLLLPNPFPLGHDQVTAFDSEENPSDILSGALPYAAFQVQAGYELPTTAKQGWLFLDLNSVSAGNPFGNQRQAWVTVVHDIESQGRFSAGWPGVALGMPSPPPIVPRAEGGTP